MQNATFFITTARSGTQWLCETLQEVYPDLLVPEHEPIRYAYAPKRCLRNPAAFAALRVEPAVRQHFDRIHEVLRYKSYIEVGFPGVRRGAPPGGGIWDTSSPCAAGSASGAGGRFDRGSLRWFDPGRRDGIKADIALAPTDPRGAPAALLRAMGEHESL